MSTSSPSPAAWASVTCLTGHCISARDVRSTDGRKIAWPWAAREPQSRKSSCRWCRKRVHVLTQCFARETKGPVWTYSRFVNHIRMQVPFTPGVGQTDLSLSFAQPRLVFVRRLVDAQVTGHAGFIFRLVLVVRQDRASAGMAQDMRAFPKTMPDGYATVEHKAVSLPGALVLRHLVEVFQDATLEMVHLVHTLADQVVCGFFAANTPGAEHRDPLVVKAVLVLLPPFGKLAEAVGLWIHRPFETADGDLVIVAGVDHRNIRALDQCVPVSGLHVMPHRGARIDIRHTHRDDLFLQTHLYARKGTLFRGGDLPVEIGATGQGAQMG